MATPSFNSGYGGWVTINGTQVAIKSWKFNDKSETARFKNSMSGERPIYQGMYKEGSVTLNLAYDFANDPLAAPFNIGPGAQLTNLQLGLHQTNRVSMTLDGPKHTASNFYVESIDQTVSTTDGSEIPLTVSGYVYGTVVYA